MHVIAMRAATMRILRKTSKDCAGVRTLYWYHPDYLGHNEFITDMAGSAYEFFHYTPWGETVANYVAGHGSFSSDYRFNGKEYDQETGNYYYGARYYNPQSVWLSCRSVESSKSESDAL